MQARDRLITSAIHLIRRNGVAGTGLSLLLDRSGTARRSLYLNFPGGKAELIADATVAAGAVIGDAIDNLASTLGPVQSVRTFIAGWRDTLDRSDFLSGCPIMAAALGPLSCIVNNASLFEYDSAADFSPALLGTHMQANVAAPLLLAQALHAATPEGGQAVVINLLDQKLYNLNPDFLSYTLSKAALHAATTMLAQALAPKLRVVGVAPGITLVSGEQTEDGFAAAHRMTPLGRSSTPQDIADAVVYAATARALTGTTLLVDGGQHLMPLNRDVMFLTESKQPPQ